MTEDRREFDARLTTIDRKLDDHGQDLREIRNSLVTIAQQAERLNSLTAMQNELRGDMNELEIRVRAGEAFRAACPALNIKSNIRVIWIYIIGVSAAVGTAMLGHIFGGKP